MIHNLYMYTITLSYWMFILPFLSLLSIFIKKQIASYACASFTCSSQLDRQPFSDRTSKLNFLDRFIIFQNGLYKIFKLALNFPTIPFWKCLKFVVLFQGQGQNYSSLQTYSDSNHDPCPKIWPLLNLNILTITWH